MYIPTEEVPTSIETEEVALNIEYKAVAVKVHVPQSITLCSIYLSRSHDVQQRLLHDLYEQLPQPVLIPGDFNSYNDMGEYID